MELEKCVFTNNDGTFIINPMDIVYIKAEGSYSLIRLKNHTDIKISKNTKCIMDKLNDCNFFIRVHRSYIVNINYVSRIASLGANSNSSALYLHDFEPILIVKEMKKVLIERLNK